VSLSPFFLREKEKEKEKGVLWHICANAKFPPKSILGLILIRCKKVQKVINVCCLHNQKF
jgi:hypothetical protein